MDQGGARIVNDDPVDSYAPPQGWREWRARLSWLSADGRDRPATGPAPIRGAVAVSPRRSPFSDQGQAREGVRGGGPGRLSTRAGDPDTRTVPR